MQASVIVILVKDYLLLLTLPICLFVIFLEPSPMNRSHHSSHTNITPQYSQSPHAAYNNMQPSAYNTVN